MMQSSPTRHLSLLRSFSRRPYSICQHSTRHLYSTRASKNGQGGYAFAFDVDGVLLRGSKPLPGATESLNLLRANNIPFILLTNGGGKHESERVAELSRILDVEITEDMFIQSHTPFKSLVDRYTDILAIGGPEIGEGEAWNDSRIGMIGEGGVREVAERYGFKTVHTPHTLLYHHPEIWPFGRPQLHNNLHHPNSPTHPHHQPTKLERPISAILVFNDPRHWGPTIQIMLDLLLSHSGELGTYSKLNGILVPGRGKFQNDNQPHLYWSNNDLLWQAEYPLPRLGQGGFRAALEGVWYKFTNGEELHATTIGKPYRPTYNYAENVLTELLRKQSGGDDGEVPLRTVYMIGDNPRSDIEGANTFKWYSILVETGVFRRDRDGGLEGLGPRQRPERVLPGVLDAVKFGIERGAVSVTKEEEKPPSS